MVNPYAEIMATRCALCRARTVVATRDILVWETTQAVWGPGAPAAKPIPLPRSTRGGKIQEMILLQGNEPIDDTTFAEIQPVSHRREQDEPKETAFQRGKEMGKAPGRAVEGSSLQSNGLRDLSLQQPKAIPSRTPCGRGLTAITTWSRLTPRSRHVRIEQSGG